MESCRRLLMQAMVWARLFALESAGNSIAAKIAMMAITASNSIKVNPFFCSRFMVRFVGIENVPKLLEFTRIPHEQSYETPVSPD